MGARDEARAERQEKLAEFLVNECHLMGPSGDGERLSSGHGWHRRHRHDEKFFLDLAKQLLDYAEESAHDYYDSKH